MSAKNIVETLEPVLANAEADGSFLLAVSRIDQILAGKNPISRQTVRRAVAFPKEIANKCDKFVNEKGFEPVKLEMPAVDLPRLRDIFFEEISADWLAGKIGDVSDINQDSFALALGNALAFLREKLPTIPAGKKSPLSSMESSEFSRAYRTISNPMTVLDDMLMGVLSRSQAETLQVVFPEIHKAFTFGIMTAAADALAKDPEYTLPWKKLKQISSLNLSNTVPESLAATLQANFKAENVNELPNSGQAVDVATGMSTNAQKIEAK